MQQQTRSLRCWTRPELACQEDSSKGITVLTNSMDKCLVLVLQREKKITLGWTSMALVVGNYKSGKLQVFCYPVSCELRCVRCNMLDCSYQFA